MDPTRLTVCVTCRFSAEAKENDDGVRGGALLASALRVAAEASAVEVVETECLWACGEACAAHLSAPGKTGYLLGRFAPTAEAAAALLAYAAAHAASVDGAVAYRAWPDGVKGHFIGRLPS